MLVIITACIREELIETYTNNGDEVTVTVSPQNEKTTRSVITNNETLNNLFAMVFNSDNKLLYTVAGTKSGGEFTFKLLSSEKRLNIYFLANVSNSLISGFTPNTLFSTVRSDLTVTTTSVTNTTGYPMVGMISLEKLSPAFNNNFSVTLLRAAASADVAINASIPTTTFEMTSVAVWRGRDAIQVIPTVDGTFNWSNPKVTAASPAGQVTVGSMSKDNVVGNSILGIILPEALPVSDADNKVTSPTVLIIGGKYNQSAKTTYYRIDFDPKQNGHPFGQILRNHKYVFNVTGVQGAGWNTPEDAANNAAIGTTVTVQPWEGEMSNVIIDEQYYFAIGSQNIILPFYVGATITIPIITNVPTFTASWSSPPVTSISPGDSFTNTHYKVKLAANKQSITITTLKNNYSTAINTSTLYIKLIGQTVPITITQGFYNSVSGGGCDILSLGNAGEGYLGTYTHWNNTAAGLKSAALKALLVHANNFGSGGRVATSRLNIFTEMNPQDDNVYLQRYIGTFNIIYLNEAVYTTGANSAQVLIDWAKNGSNHFLIFMYDRASNSKYNWHVLNKLGLANNTTYYMTLGAYTLYTENYDDAVMDPIFRGPFGTVAKGFLYRNYDGPQAEIDIAAAQSKGIYPILKGDNGGMVLGIDFTKRIVYCGDVDIFNGLAGVTAGQYINTDDATSGSANDATKLIANLWAYMIRTTMSN